MTNHSLFLPFTGCLWNGRTVPEILDVLIVEPEEVAAAATMTVEMTETTMTDTTMTVEVTLNPLPRGSRRRARAQSPRRDRRGNRGGNRARNQVTNQSRTRRGSPRRATRLRPKRGNLPNPNLGAGRGAERRCISCSSRKRGRTGMQRTSGRPKHVGSDLQRDRKRLNRTLRSVHPRTPQPVPTSTNQYQLTRIRSRHRILFRMDLLTSAPTVRPILTLAIWSRTKCQLLIWQYWTRRSGVHCVQRFHCKMTRCRWFGPMYVVYASKGDLYTCSSVPTSANQYQPHPTDTNRPQTRPAPLRWTRREMTPWLT